MTGAVLPSGGSNRTATVEMIKKAQRVARLRANPTPAPARGGSAWQVLTTRLSYLSWR